MKETPQKLKKRIKALLKKLKLKIKEKPEETPTKKREPRKIEAEKKPAPVKKEKPRITTKPTYQPKPTASKRYWDEDEKYPENHQTYHKTETSSIYPKNLQPESYKQFPNPQQIFYHQPQIPTIPTTYFPQEIQLPPLPKTPQLQKLTSHPHKHHHHKRPCGGKFYAKYHQELKMINPHLKNYSSILVS